LLANGRGVANLRGIMPVFEIVVASVALAVVGFQAWLTRRVFQSQLYERKQKIWQAQLIWLLPVLGAGLVFSILQEDRKAESEVARLGAAPTKSTGMPNGKPKRRAGSANASTTDS
jgi:hypothetical protein